MSKFRDLIRAGRLADRVIQMAHNQIKQAPVCGEYLQKEFPSSRFGVDEVKTLDLSLTNNIAWTNNVYSCVPIFVTKPSSTKILAWHLNSHDMENLVQQKSDFLEAYSDFIQEDKTKTTAHVFRRMETETTENISRLNMAIAHETLEELGVKQEVHFTTDHIISCNLENGELKFQTHPNEITTATKFAKYVVDRIERSDQQPPSLKK